MIELPYDQEREIQTLKSYGLLMGCAIALLFGLYPWLMLKRSLVLWPFGVCVGFVLVALVCPRILGPLYRLWMVLGSVLGGINSKILLSLCYWILFSPVAILFKISGRDRLHLREGSALQSYRHRRQVKKDNSMMELPF